MILTDSIAGYAGAATVNAIASESASRRHFHVYGAVTVSQAITGSIGLVKNGAGILTLSATNTFSGNTAINAGTLSITSTASLPGWNTNGRFSVAPAAILAVYNAVSDADVTTLRGTTNFQANSLLGFDTTSGNRSYTVGIANTSQGALGVAKVNANTLTLGGTNTYTGPTNVLGGTLLTDAANRIPDASAVTISSGATLQLGGADTFATLAGAGTMTCGANALTLNSANSAAFTGTFSNTAGTFTKTGTGTQGLKGTSTVAAGIQLTGGTLEIAGTFTQTAAPAPRNTQIAINAAQTASLSLLSGSATFTGLFFGENNGGRATVNVNSGTLTVNGQTWQSGVVSTLNITGGSFVSQQFDIGGGGNVSTTSTVTLASGLFSLVSLFRWGQGGTSGITTTSTFNLDGGTFSNGNAWLALKGSNTFNFNGGVFTSSTTPLNLTGLLISFLVKAGGAIIAPTSGKTINFDSVLSDASGVAGTLTKQDAGTLVLSQPNTISGAVTVSGGVLQIGNGGTTGSLANASTIANNATLNFNRTNTLTQGTDFPGITGTGIVQQLGSGTLILSGTNTYSGNTFIQNGNVQMAALPVGEIRFTVNFQGALQFAAGRTTDLSSRVLNNTNLVRIDTGGQSVTFASLGSTNSGGLVKIGTGTLTLSGTGNTFTGAFGVNAGTLDLSGSKTTASRVYCADTAGTATLTISGTLTQTTNTSGVRTLQVGQIGTGTLTVPTGGTVNGAFGMMLGENSGGSGTLNLTGGTVNLNGELWFAATTAVANVNSGTLTATRIYIGGGSSSGGSTSTLNIAGGSMTADVIDFGIGGTNTTTTVNLNSGSFSVLDFFIRRTGGVAQGTHTFNFNGATLAFRQTSTVFSELVCSVLSGGALINIASGATTTWSAVLANGGGGGGLTKSGAGTLVLTAANTYTGATSTLAGTTRVTQIISGTAGKLSQANFTNTALSVTFGTTPSATDSFKLFPGATTQTYSTVTLTNGGGLTGYYDSSTSTLSFNYNPTPATDLTVSPAVKADSSPYTGGTVSMVNPYTTSSFFVTATATTSTAIRFRLHQTSGPNTQNILATLNDFSVTAASYTRQTIISAQNSGANTTQIIVNGVGGGVFVSAFGSTTLYFFLEVSTSTGSIISRAADGSNFAITFNGA